MAGRGMLTPEMQELSFKSMGWEISQRELRLMPYCLDCAINNRNISPRHITQEEREILGVWRGAGLIEGGAADFELTRHGFDCFMPIIYLGYIAHD